MKRFCIVFGVFALMYVAAISFSVTDTVTVEDSLDPEVMVWCPSAPNPPTPNYNSPYNYGHREFERCYNDQPAPPPPYLTCAECEILSKDRCYLKRIECVNWGDNEQDWCEWGVENAVGFYCFTTHQDLHSNLIIFGLDDDLIHTMFDSL